MTLSGERIRVVQFGLGPIGLSCVRTLLQKKPTGVLELVGAIDIDSAKVGRTVGELTGDSCDIVVTDNAEFTLRHTSPDVVLHTTSSSLPLVQQQLTQCMQADANVVSSTEELFYPTQDNDQVESALNEIAEMHGVTLFGTGVNPGYAMDVLAVMATGVCTRVRSIRALRCVDASQRRLPLQKKIGAGLTREAFSAQPGFGHAGLVESCWLVANGLGFDVDNVTETLEPVMATKQVVTPYLTVEKGQVAGIHQVARARSGDSTFVLLDLYMYVGAENAIDQVIVDGDPPIELAIEGGIFGDTATVGALINAIPLVLSADPGLKSALELPIPRCFMP